MHQRDSKVAKLLRLVPGHPVVIIAAVLGVAVFALSRIVDLQTGASRLRIDPSIDTLLPAGDESRIFLDRFEETFAAGDTILVALKDDDVFTSRNLARIRRISEEIHALPEVHRVASLALSVNIRSENGSLVVENFYEGVPESADQLSDLRDRALADPIYSGNLISADGRVTVVLVTLLDISDLELQSSGVDAKVRAIVESEWSHGPTWITGIGHIKTQLNEVIVSDMTVIVPIACLLMAIVTFIAFRSIRAVVVVVLSIQIAVLITIGFIAFQYEMLNQVTSAIPSILFVIGFTYAIHILAGYYDSLREFEAQGRENADIVFVTLDKVFMPVIFTGLTTAAGFFSLATSPLEAIKQYGVGAGVGVVVTMAVSLTFTPALLALLPVPEESSAPAGDERFNRSLVRLAGFDIRNRNRILLAGALVAVVSLAGLLRIEIGYDFVSVFKTRHPVRVDFDAVNSSFEGANGFNIAIETSVTDGFKEPENLAFIDALQKWLNAQPEIGGTTSITDYLKALYQGIEAGDRAYFRLPESAELVSQLLVIGETEEMDQFVDTDFQSVNIAIRTTAMNSREVLPLVERIEARLRELPPHLRSRVTGDSVIVSRTMDDIAYGQATSLLSAFGSIFVILSVLFTSFRAGFIALIPNVLPVMVYFGILGWAGIELNVTTGIIACLVLGIAVDDTIHILTHFNRGARQSADEERGVTHALLVVGRPVTYTTVALCLGFLCLLFSEMRTQFEFGWLAAVTLASAWLIDMTFTPALAARIRIVTIWDVISLDLGDAPHRSIPLFDGLSANQAKVAALLGSMTTFSAGDCVFKANEPGDYLYVIIDGRLEVSVRSGDNVVVLNQLGRGAVLGEIALFSGVRSADVHAITDVRLLRLDLDDLRRIQRRRPRIGAQIYANLSRSQAQRIIELTDRVA